MTFPTESELRRQAVAQHRANFRLEGIEPPPAILRLEEQYIKGEIDEQGFQQGCLAFAYSLAQDSTWHVSLPGD